MNEVANFFSLDSGNSISLINKWAENKLGEDSMMIHVETDLIVHYF